MKFSKSRIIRLAVLLVFFTCMLFANFYAVRKIMRLGLEMYFYDKLLVAYNIGGAKGLTEELDKIRSDDKMPRELPLAKDFEGRIKILKDPAQFLSDKVEQNRRKVNLIRNLRTAAIALMIIIFCWQMMLNFLKRFKQKRRKT